MDFFVEKLWPTISCGHWTYTLSLHGCWAMFISCLHANIIATIIFTALHGMHTQSSDENSVCRSVCQYDPKFQVEEVALHQSFSHG